MCEFDKGIHFPPLLICSIFKIEFYFMCFFTIFSLSFYHTNCIIFYSVWEMSYNWLKATTTKCIIFIFSTWSCKSNTLDNVVLAKCRELLEPLFLMGYHFTLFLSPYIHIKSRWIWNSWSSSNSILTRIVIKIMEVLFWSPDRGPKVYRGCWKILKVRQFWTSNNRGLA